jgi:pimeloyl-ACP methyl ester carboxylesterase
MAVLATSQTLQRYLNEIRPGVMMADRGGLDRIQRRWPLSVDPDNGPAYLRPTLVLTGRQDDIVGYVDQFGLLDRFPRATYAVLDLAGHNLQIKRPALFDALMHDWLDRVLS